MEARYVQEEEEEEEEEEMGGGDVYNILPVHDMLADHDGLRFPEVRAAVAALQSVGGLCPPPEMQWHQGMDLLDWLGAFFCFQRDNIRNQREHIVLLLANYQMQMSGELLEPIDRLGNCVVERLRKKVLKNYTKWCSFLGRKANLWLPKARQNSATPVVVDARRELLYTSLYLLVWGEAANLRFMPECICFIFHNVAGELNRILEDYIDESTAQKARPFYRGENAFLLNVITPLYEVIRAEANSSCDGKAPHSEWRNYDDMNEYFWSKRCLSQLSWPLRLDSNYLVKPEKAAKGKFRNEKVGKTGFVERRSFWNVFRSFDHLWTGYILMLQAMIIIAWNGSGLPWEELTRKDSQARVLSIFITWAGLRVLQSILDVIMQFRLVSRETILVGFRMVLKMVVALVWTVAFTVLYLRMWSQRRIDEDWSTQASERFFLFLEVAVVFILPEVLALTLFILPWIRNFIEKSEYKVFYLLTWWFQSREFVGRGLREGIYDNIKYTLFWLGILLAKFAFSFFMQVRPMIVPTKQILAPTMEVSYSWYEFSGGGSDRFLIIVIWAPVLLIYFTDTQIWYAIFSSVVGAMVGLLSHLGEIRDLQQLKLRFPFFASAVSFNLLPEEAAIGQAAWLTWWSKLKEAWRRFLLRYGLGFYKKIQVGTAEAGKFTQIWNEIIYILREEDLISDREVELLAIPLQVWNVSVVQWPSILLSNEILIALAQARSWQGMSDKALWRKICKNEYRKCAVVECFESLEHLLKRILKQGSKEYSIIDRLFEDAKAATRAGIFTKSYNVNKLVGVHARVVALLDVLAKKPQGDDERVKVVAALQYLYDEVIRDLMVEKRHVESLQDAGLAGDSHKLLFVDAVVFPDVSDEAFYRQLRRLKTTLSTKEMMNNVPRNLEARRRLAFFSNSLFMKMPRAPPVEKMPGFSVLTPYYSEDVLYSKDALHRQNEDGISTLFYLQRIYPDEWANFVERIGLTEEELWNHNKVLEVRLWASYRGQTLARTVRGMMYYYRALQMLAYLESASEMEILQGRNINATEPEIAMGLLRLGSNLSTLYRRSQHKATAMIKFTYVVTCQIYGAQKEEKKANAEDILYLMKKNEALRIAYVHEVQAGWDTKNYYSVLVKYDPFLEKEVEVYRIQLPGPLKLGEGKPENQNHAIIFTRGEAVQTIDMNQDNCFEEALKMRNLLQEFRQKYGLRHPQILGVREHVFTGSVSSLAWFMSAQETSFVTLGQRVLANPLKVRMHYGHPDVFDRLWFITRGGMSKASRVINISEDIFAGFNCTLRGGNVTHHEYIQVGKGRDVGLNQIALFEAKVASGNGEQVLSRDVYRLAHRLDFFRMLSFYYTTVGFYVSNMMIVLTVYAFLWGRLYLVLSGAESSIEARGDLLSNRALAASLNQQFVVQIGLFTALPMIIENSLEHGFGSAIWNFLKMQLQLSSVFFTFSMGTRAHFFGRTLLHGGAKYRATGRGFVVKHEAFAEIYRLFSRSHFVKAIEIIFILIAYMAYGGSESSSNSTRNLTYVLLTLSCWFLALSWILAPFLFNPSGFDWLKTVDDFDDFANWIWYKGLLVKADQSWEVWWCEEQDHLRYTGFWGKMFEILLSLRFFFFQYGLSYRLNIFNQSKSIFVYILSWSYLLAVVLFWMALSRAARKYSVKQHLLYRAIQALALLIVVLVVFLLFEFTGIQLSDLVTCVLAFIPTGWGLLSIALVLRSFIENTKLWSVVAAVARIYDLAIGLCVFIPVAVLSWLPGFQAMQTRILFNEAFSRGLQISRILVGKRPNSNYS